MTENGNTMAMDKRSEWIIVGISGVTCGGKTTLANKLINTLAPVYVFHQDKYFFPDDSPRHIKCNGIAHNNYDILSSLDMDKMYEDVLTTVNGENKAHETVLEDEGKFGLTGKKFLILDGFTILNFKPLLEICDLMYYFVLEYEVCAARRCYRLYDPPDIDGYFDACVWPEHLKYRAEIEKEKRVKILDGTMTDSLDVVINDIKQKFCTN